MDEKNEENTYVCEKCNKDYKQRSGLSRHKRTCGAADKALFMCNTCHKKFTRGDSLMKHINEERCKTPGFPCDKCEKVFTSSYFLKRHAVVHEEKKIYSCESCKKTYVRKNLYLKHVCVENVLHVDVSSLTSKMPKDNLDDIEMLDDSLPSMINLEIADASFHDVSGNVYSDSFVDAPVSALSCGGFEAGGEKMDSDYSDMVLENRYGEETEVNKIDYAGGSNANESVASLSQIDLSYSGDTTIISDNSFNEDASCIRGGVENGDVNFSIISESDVSYSVSSEDIVGSVVASVVNSNNASVDSRVASVLSELRRNAATKKALDASNDNMNSTNQIDMSNEISGNSVPMSSSTRQKKFRIVNHIMDAVGEVSVDNMNTDDKVDIMKTVLNRLGLKNEFLNPTKPTKKGRKMTSIETREKVWKFWHENSSQSTLTSRPAKLNVRDKPKIQSSLKFKESLVQTNKRGTTFYVSTWQTTEKTYMELNTIYNTMNPDNPVSYGTFFALKPFYIRAVTTSDIEMCCCKKHLHARWSVKAFLDCANKQKLGIPFTDYSNFFEFLTSDCTKTTTTSYLDWSCTKDNKTVCPEIQHRWHCLSSMVLPKQDKDIKVTMQSFEKVSTGKFSLKTGKEIKKLSQRSDSLNLQEIQKFLDGIYVDIIFHRNQLKHFRTAVPIINASFSSSLYIDIDFSENLKVPVKWEPQSMHWHHEQVTVHASIVKVDGEKKYVTHFSEDKSHDNVFVNEVITRIVESAPRKDVILINSDNCSTQYKCIQHFYKIQQLADSCVATVIRIWSIAGHGKGEVDHVGGLAKVTLRRAIAGGDILKHPDGMVDYLENKFGSKNHPTYEFSNITPNTLIEERANDQLMNYRTIDGSSKFQVAVVKTGCTVFRAAPHLCVCSTCMEHEYGSCCNFQDVEMVVGRRNKVALRNDVVEEVSNGDEDEVVLDFAAVESIIAIPYSGKRQGETIDLVKVVAHLTNNKKEKIYDDWGQGIEGGQSYLEVRYLLKDNETSNGFNYKLDNRITYIFKESIVYPFIQTEQTMKKCKNVNVVSYFITLKELNMVESYVQTTGMIHL